MQARSRIFSSTDIIIYQTEMLQIHLTTTPSNPSQRSALPCQCYRGVLWSISAPAEKNEFASQLFRMFYGEYKDMSFDSQLYAFGCNRVSESKIMFHKNHGGTKLLD